MRDRIIYCSNYGIEKLNTDRKTFYRVPMMAPSFTEGEIYKFTALLSNHHESFLAVLDSIRDIKYREETYRQLSGPPIVYNTVFIEEVVLNVLVIETALEQLILLYGDQS